METRKNNSTRNHVGDADTNIVKPEFRKHDGTMIKIKDMSDDELINGIDLLDSLNTRRQREIEKLSKVKQFMVLEYQTRFGSHITTPCNQRVIGFKYANS